MVCYPKSHSVESSLWGFLTSPLKQQDPWRPQHLLAWGTLQSASGELPQAGLAAFLAYLHLLRGEPGQSSSSFSLKLKGKTSLLPWLQQNNNKHSFVGLTKLQIKGGQACWGTQISASSFSCSRSHVHSGSSLNSLPPPHPDLFVASWGPIVCLSFFHFLPGLHRAMLGLTLWMAPHQVRCRVNEDQPKNQDLGSWWTMGSWEQRQGNHGDTEPQMGMSHVARNSRKLLRRAQLSPSQPPTALGYLREMTGRQESCVWSAKPSGWPHLHTQATIQALLLISNTSQISKAPRMPEAGPTVTTPDELSKS